MSLVQAQESVWKGYFSYNSISSLSVSKESLIAASENALFSVDKSSNKITTITTLEGLSGEIISTTFTSTNFEKTFVGYKNGLIQIISQDGIKTIVDIRDKLSITSNKKRINNFYEHETSLFISSDFGIVEFDIDKEVVVDTYFIGNNGMEVSVQRVALREQILYAATLEEGIKYISVSNSAKVDYSEWSTLTHGNFRDINVFRNGLIASTWDNNLLYFDGANFGVIGNTQSIIHDSVENDENLIIVAEKEILFFDVSFRLFRSIKASQDQIFTGGVIMGGKIYIGTKSQGVVVYDLSSGQTVDTILPSGPLRNSIFSLTHSADQLWAVYGDHTSGYNPYPLDELSVSFYNYNSKDWDGIPYSSLKESKSIVRAAINPQNENHVFLSSFFSGLVEVLDGNVVKLYDKDNSGLETLIFGSPDYVDIRINGSDFDSEGNLWVNNSFVEKGLKKYDLKNDTWSSYVLDREAPFNTSYGALLIDKNDTKWVCSNTDGLLGFNETRGSFPKQLKSGGGNGNLPSDDVRSIAIDHNNQLWIGTKSGLRVLSNVDLFMTSGQLSSDNIVILDDGLAQELLYEQFISDILVDGANRKWIATVGSGLFYVSSNGQKTIHHFTESNSPLPSNNILDLEMNPSTGELFIATERGMVSFNSSVTGSNEDLTNVLVYPNPVRPHYKGDIKISGLQDQSNIKITDVSGNLVYQASAEGGTLLWNGTVFGGRPVASGVYLVFIATPSGETETKKIMIIR